ncbi:MAG: hypothetical protein CVT86_08445, partial [Alphaproteobacteria bacterium HGW-Alphaproteobacteria-8]
MKHPGLAALAAAALLVGCAGGGETILPNEPQPITPNRASQFTGGQQSVEVIGAPPDGASAAMIV